MQAEQVTTVCRVWSKHYKEKVICLLDKARQQRNLFFFFFLCTFRQLSIQYFFLGDILLVTLTNEERVSINNINNGSDFKRAHSRVCHTAGLCRSTNMSTYNAVRRPSHFKNYCIYGFRLIFCMAIWKSISMAHVQSQCLGSFPSFFSPLYARFYTRSLRVCEYRGTFSGEREKMSIILFCNNTIFPLHHINYHQNHPCQKSWEYKNKKCWTSI